MNILSSRIEKLDVIRRRGAMKNYSCIVACATNVPAIPDDISLTFHARRARRTITPNRQKFPITFCNLFVGAILKINSTKSRETCQAPRRWHAAAHRPWKYPSVSEREKIADPTKSYESPVRSSFVSRAALHLRANANTGYLLLIKWIWIAIRLVSSLCEWDRVCARARPARTHTHAFNALIGATESKCCGRGLGNPLIVDTEIYSKTSFFEALR